MTCARDGENEISVDIITHYAPHVCTGDDTIVVFGVEIANEYGFVRGPYAAMRACVLRTKGVSTTVSVDIVFCLLQRTDRGRTVREEKKMKRY